MYKNLDSTAELDQLKQLLHSLLFHSCQMVCVVMGHLLSVKQHQSKQRNTEVTEHLSRALQIIYMNPFITGTWIVTSETLRKLLHNGSLKQTCSAVIYRPKKSKSVTHLEFSSLPLKTKQTG